MLVSWSRDPPGRAGCKPVLKMLRAPTWQGSRQGTQGAGLALPVPEPMTELRSGCQAVAFGTSRHQLLVMQISKGQLVFSSAGN